MTYVDLKNDEVRVNWEGKAANPFDLEYGAKGFSIGSGTQVNNLTDTTYLIQSLEDTTSYDVYTRIAGGSSCWVGPLSFTTLICDPMTLPYEESFENAGQLPSCWYQSQADNYDWTVHTGATGTSGSGPSAAQNESYYVYYEASGTTSSDEAILIGPTFDLTENTFAQISFYYHLYGINSGVGSLFLEIEALLVQVTGKKLGLYQATKAMLGNKQSWIYRLIPIKLFKFDFALFQPFNLGVILLLIYFG